MADATVSLGLDGSEFEAGLQRAAISARAFAGQLGSVVGGGATLGAAAVLTIGKAAVEARSNFDALVRTTDKATLFKGSGFFRESGEIDNNIQTLRRSMEELDEAQRPTTTGGVIGKVLRSDALYPGGPSTQDAQIDERRKAVLSAIGGEFDAQLSKQRAITAATREAVLGDEKRAEVMRSLIKYKERIGEIDNKYSGIEGGGENLKALQAEAAAQNQLELEEIRRNHALKDNSEEYERQARQIERSARALSSNPTERVLARHELALERADAQYKISAQRSKAEYESKQDNDAERSVQLLRRGHLSPDRLNLFSSAISARRASVAFRNADPGLDREEKEVGMLRAGANFRDARQGLYLQDHGEDGYNFAAHAAERRRVREYASFDANESDRQDRKSRGAYNDSSDLSASSYNNVLESIRKGIDEMVRKWE